MIIFTDPSAAATKCNYRSTITDCPMHALRMADNRAEISGRRYGVYSCGNGKYRVRRVTGHPQSALEIITPSWSYEKDWRTNQIIGGAA